MCQRCKSIRQCDLTSSAMSIGAPRSSNISVIVALAHSAAWWRGVQPYYPTYHSVNLWLEIWQLHQLDDSYVIRLTRRSTDTLLHLLVEMCARHHHIIQRYKQWKDKGDYDITLPVSLIFAPRFNNNSMVVAWPCRAAWWRGVLPFCTTTTTNCL